MGILMLAIPMIAVILFLLFHERRLLHGISILTSSLLLISGLCVIRNVICFKKVQYSALGGIFYVDSFSAILLGIVLFIGFLTSIYSIGYMEKELEEGKLSAGRLKIYYLLMYAFLFTMLFALTVKNMGMMWIAIEATTLASVFLVGLQNNRNALEAAWKYIIICSVGIAIAMLGIILLHFSSMDVLHGGEFLDWTALYDHADALKSNTCRLAFLFILVGFGTKAGLAPMHTWLPDAHSQAPSPISALLSGVLLNSAMYGIIRTAAIVNRNLGSSEYTGRLLIVFGILSITTAAIFILTQQDYKRLLAYSSIEHMGIIAVAIGVFSPIAVFGAIYHMINHSLTKSMLFLSSGSILQKYNTKQIMKVKGLLHALPVSGTVFLLGLFSIAGTPPFSVFSSELSIIISLFQTKLFIVGAVVAFLLALVFAGIARTLFPMFYGKPDADMVSGETNLPGTCCLVLLLIAISLTGLYMPEWVTQLIHQAQKTIIGE